MSNLIYSLNATVPVFAVMVIGYLIRCWGIVGEGFVKDVNKFVFRVSLPVMIFVDMWNADIHREFDVKLILFCLIASVVSYIVIWIGAELFIKDKTMIGAFVQGSFRSSAAILGFAFILNMYDDLGMAPLMVIGAVPFYNVGAVIVLTFRGKDKVGLGGFKQIKKALLNILTNPMIIGIVLGCLASLIKLKLPVVVSKTLDIVGDATVPMALVAIGAGFTFASSKSHKKLAVAATIIKLLLIPVVVLPLAAYMGFKNQEMLAIIIMSASPATATGYVMAREMNNDYVLSSYIIVLTTVLSAFTLTGWIFLMKCLGCLY